jgi:hypothetical protein
MNETEQLHDAASRFSEMKILIIDDELANVALLGIGAHLVLRGIESEAEIKATSIDLAADNLNGMTDQFMGIGDPLGLAISKAIMTMHDGTICARSDGLGQGTTFLITLAVEKGTSENDELTDKAHPPQ